MSESENNKQAPNSKPPFDAASDDPERYYRKLAEKSEQLVEMTDWAYVTMEFSNLETQWEEGPDPGEIDITPWRDRVAKAKEAFDAKKEDHYEEQRKIREKNLAKKQELLNRLHEIVEKKNWTAVKDVGHIRGRWDQLKPLPEGEAEELQKKYERLLSEFEDHKVDRIVRKKQREEESLTGKLLILDKMDALNRTLDEKPEDWQKAEKDLDKLNKQWHKIGRVPAERNQEIWGRYHSIQDQFHQLRFKHDKKYRQQIEKFLSRKKQLIQEAEALIDDPDLAAAARRVNKLHRQWKKIGNLPQKDENELWDLFKKATDTFNEKKSNNIDQLREQEEKNLEEKKRLIQEAEKLNQSEQWEETHDQYQKLMKEWKQSGPVPKRMSGNVWKQFKQAMDVFYDRRRDHFKQLRKKRKGNLEEKQEVLDKLKALKDHENPIKAVEEAKPLQEEFKKAGAIPPKHKNKMWKEYRETCDVIYDRFRAAKSAADIVGSENVSDYSTDDLAQIRKHQKDARKLRKEVNRLTDEVLQMKESLSYFKPRKGSSLLDEVHEKIEAAEKKIEKKEDQLEEVEKQIDRLQKDSEENAD